MRELKLHAVSYVGRGQGETRCGQSGLYRRLPDGTPILQTNRSEIILVLKPEDATCAFCLGTNLPRSGNKTNNGNRLGSTQTMAHVEARSSAMRYYWKAKRHQHRQAIKVANSGPRRAR